jgi:RIO-like serine/threonine protein kinase
VRDLNQSEDVYGLIHSDMQPHNMILRGSQLFVIDFESLIRHLDFISSLEGYIGSIGDKKTTH